MSNRLIAVAFIMTFLGFSQKGYTEDQYRFGLVDGSVWSTNSGDIKVYTIFYDDAAKQVYEKLASKVDKRLEPQLSKSVPGILCVYEGSGRVDGHTYWCRMSVIAGAQITPANP